MTGKAKHAEPDIYRLDQVLEAAVKTYWPDLMPNEQKGLIHLEYELAENGTVNYFQIWSSIVHGYWRLVCTYDPSPALSSNSAIHVENDCSIEELSDLLNLIMQHEDRFLPALNLGRQGLLQITKPSPSEIAEAAIRLNKTMGACNFTHHESVPA